MNVILAIPDEFAARFGSAAELGRRAVEALAVEEFRAGRLTRPELGQLLGLVIPQALDSFLEMHGFAAHSARADNQTPADAALTDRAERAQARELVERFRTFRAGKTLGGLDLKALIAEGRR